MDAEASAGTGMGAQLTSFLSGLQTVVPKETKTFVFYREDSDDSYEVPVEADVGTMKDVLDKVRNCEELLQEVNHVEFTMKKKGQEIVVRKTLDDFKAMTPRVFFDVRMYPYTEFTLV